MNSQEAAVSLCQERDFWEMGPGACEGGGGREIWNAAPPGVNAVAPPRWPMGKKTWESTLPERSKISILRGRLNDHVLRQEPRLSLPHWTDRRARAIRVLRMTWGILCSAARPGRTFLARSCRRMVFSDEKRISRSFVALSELAQRNGEGYALPGATPPSSCCQGRYAPLTRWPAASLDSGVLRGSLRTSPFSFRKMGIFQSELRAKYLVHDLRFCS